MHNFIKFLKNLPVQMLISITTAITLAPFLTPRSICWCYTISTVFVDLLMIILPLIVFIYILSAIIGMEKRSPLMVGLIFVSVTISNALALLFAYVTGRSILPTFTLPEANTLFQNLQSTIQPMLCIKSPITFGTDKAMMIGIIVGLVTTLLPAHFIAHKFIHHVSYRGRNAITLFLQKVFIPLLPLYVFGFSLKMAYEGTLSFLISTYAHVFILSMIVVIVYIFSLYFIAANGNINRAFKYIRTMIPAGITGFSTMSSAASLPIALDCTRRNLQNKHFPEFILPATSNIHMLGDDLTIVLTALSLLIMQGLPIPDLSVFLPFAGAFCIAKLSCVGIPGASVLVVLPVLQHYLGFSPEMISMVTTIYILQDPFGTCANVMGNGAFAIIMHKFSKKILNIEKV